MRGLWSTWGLRQQQHVHAMHYAPCTCNAHTRLHEHEYQVLTCLRLSLRLHRPSPPLVITPLLFQLQRGSPGLVLDRTSPCRESLCSRAPCARTT